MVGNSCRELGVFAGIVRSENLMNPFTPFVPSVLFSLSLMSTALPAVAREDGGGVRAGRKTAASVAPAAPVWVLDEVKAPQVRRGLFESQAAKTKVSYYVLTPPGYEASGERRFPVLYWLHGSGGSRGLAEISGRFLAAMQQGKIPPMIVVFPNGLPMGMWCDWKDGSVRMETIVIKELLPHIDATFRTTAQRSGRIVEGFSMGGYGAARLGLKFPDLFAAASLLGAGPLQENFTEAPRAGPHGRDRVLGTVYGGDAEYFREQSPWRLAQQYRGAEPGPALRLRQVIGVRDATYGFNRAFHEHLARLGIPHAFTALPGVEHNPLAVLDALGEGNWEFYRAVFSAAPRAD